MDNRFFEHPILNSPYEYPMRHWELDGSGQPTQKTIESRRPAGFITPIPKPRRQRGREQQRSFSLGDDEGFLPTASSMIAAAVGGTQSMP